MPTKKIKKKILLCLVVLFSKISLRVKLWYTECWAIGILFTTIERGANVLVNLMYPRVSFVCLKKKKFTIFK